MFETTIERDLANAKSKAEREAIGLKIFNKYRGEFLAFIQELKDSDIAQELYNSSTPEEAFSIWRDFSSENQDLFARIRSWAEARDDYFNTHEHAPLFEENETVECFLEVGLMIFITGDECLLNEEDINADFDANLYTLLKEHPNELLKAAGWYIDCCGYENMTEDNIYTFYQPED